VSTVEDRVLGIERELPVLTHRVASLETDLPDEVGKVEMRVVKIEGYMWKAIGLILLAFATAAINLVIKGVFPSGTV